MTASTILKRILELVAALLTAFGGYLTNIAPPDPYGNGATGQGATGIASFASLIVLLLIASLPESVWKNASRKIWIVLGAVAGIAAIGSLLDYNSKSERLVFSYRADSTQKELQYVSGLRLTASGQEFMKENHSASSADMMANAEGKPELIWTKDSIAEARAILVTRYVIVVVLMTITIFSLIEVILKNAPSP